MKSLLCAAVLLISLSAVTWAAPVNETKLENLEETLRNFNDELNKWENKKKLADWDYETNLTDSNLEVKLNVISAAGNYHKQIRERISDLKDNIASSKDENIMRQFCKLRNVGVPILPENQYREYEGILSRAEKLLSTLTICDHKDAKKCNLTLEPDLTLIMANSRDPEELKHVWVEWHNVCGKTMLPQYPKWVELMNEAAKLNEFKDTNSFYFSDYESSNLTEVIEALWQEVKPFYLQLHAYVRRALNKQYGENVVSKTDPIPAHLLGNMWSRIWSNVATVNPPYPDKKEVDVTAEMIKQEYNPNKIYRLAETAFTSMGMPKMSDMFWEKSILAKPKDREIVYEARSWDFYDGKDYRVIQDTRNSMEDLIIAHRMMGHIHYFMQYKDQPFAYKRAANWGFYEAVGDLLGLSITTPSHLKKIDLLKSNASDPEIELNNLYYKALNKVVNLPYAYAMEKWRWDVFDGKITPKQYNCKWWKIKDEIQGIKPPVERSDDDFDPGTDYHIAVDTQYLKYFTSTILQFQMHKALCIKAGEYNPNDPTKSKPLHLCDITGNAEAGNALKSMMQMGRSKKWPEVLEKITGEQTMNATGLLEYFKPLHEWLKTENEKNSEQIGWTKSQKECP